MDPSRRPFDMASLPPNLRQQLLQGQPVPFDDGVMLYPDGTYSPGQTPGYQGAMGGGGGYDYGAGGYNASPQLQGPQIMAQQSGAPSTSPFMDPASGQLLPQFQRYFATSNAGGPQPPVQPALGAAAVNPMQEPMVDPAQPVQLPSQPPTQWTGGVQTSTPSGQMYGGRVGRRMQSRMGQRY